MRSYGNNFDFGPRILWVVTFGIFALMVFVWWCNYTPPPPRYNFYYDPQNVAGKLELYPNLGYFHGSAPGKIQMKSRINDANNR